MKPMLDDLQLPQVQEVTTYDRRTLPEHKPPGMGGSLFQNLGRSPTGILLWGVATGPDALSFAEKLQKKFSANKPVRFTADIVMGARISNVMIENLRVEDMAGKPGRFAYVLSLRESIKPAKGESSSAVDADIAGSAKNIVGQLVNSVTKQKQ
jgi:hypothetical protein